MTVNHRGAASLPESSAQADVRFGLPRLCSADECFDDGSNGTEARMLPNSLRLHPPASESLRLRFSG